MITVYSAQHALHRPATEVLFGRLVPHRELPERATNIAGQLRAADLGRVIPPCAHGLDALTRVHSSDLIEFLATAAEQWAASGRPLPALPHTWPRTGYTDERRARAPGRRIGYFAADTCTPITEGTWAAARSAADCALTAAALLAAGEAEGLAFALCRPPGHHAGRGYFGGYCYLNNAALAADLLAEKGMTAILDIDYHHGNGTQDIFWERPDVVYVSIHADPDHEYPFYSGYRHETGGGPGAGATRNYPLALGAAPGEWLGAFRDAVRFVASLAPEHQVVSLGTDTAAGDPIGTFRLTTTEFTLIGSAVASLGIPVLYVLEGGYQPGHIAGHILRVLQAHDPAFGRLGSTAPP